MMENLFDFVFCCLSDEQKKQVSDALHNHAAVSVYDAQVNLVKQKHGYRCNKCGQEYPFLRLEYANTQADPKAYAKQTGHLEKGKKAADVFCGSFYYAKNKRTLQKFERDLDGEFVQTDAIPVMNDVYQTIISRDGRYIATETFGGTITVTDTHTKQLIAKKARRKINGSFVFTDENKLLYFFEAAVRCWDFLKNEDEILWHVPAQWTLSDDPKKQVCIVCSSAIHNETEHACSFVFRAGNTITYVVSFRNLEFTKVAKLPGVPAGCRLVFSAGTNQYTLSENGSINIYNSDFTLVEKIEAPAFHIVHDGGGAFPITRHKGLQPNRTFLSPDGKWLLLDYFNYVILMDREKKEIRFCLYSYRGKVALHMGFADKDHIWYTWGDTTYIQEIK